MVTEDYMSVKEIINDFQENYGKVRKLLDDSKNDPENEPYLSKYKAKDILSNMRDSLKQAMNSESSLSKMKLDAMLGVVLLNIGIINMETEELTASDQVLTEAEEILSPYSCEPEVIITIINVYNNLGILWSNREDPEKAKSFLVKAKELYEQFKCTLKMPLCIEQLPVLTSENVTGDFLLFEKTYTLTLYYLAQVYAALKETLKSAIYCHITLRRQLEYSDFEPIEWALNAATLSQVFAELSGFYQSRHHLAAASTILDQHEAQLQASESIEEAHLAKVETLKHRSADVARCWAKYCIMLMTSSKLRLMMDNDQLSEPITDLSNLSLEDNENICDGDIRSLIFPNLDVSKYESKVTDKYLLTFSDARDVFIQCQNWLNKAKEYYKLDTLASDHIELVQDSSQSYTYLAFFEEDDERRAKMLKRRVDMLEDLIKEINPTYYLHFCRQIWYELGEVYLDILNLKLDKINNSNEKPTPHALKKINMLCDKSIENFDHFLKSYRDKNGLMPIKFDREMIRPVINAYAYIGRNSMKRVAVNKSIQVGHVKKSLEAYQAVVDICENNEEAASMMREEFTLCNEMVRILPIKINKLERELAA